jgi:hypothetical protein
MSLARKAFVVSCIAGFAMNAEAAPQGAPNYTLYASTSDPAGGFEYVRLVPDDAVLGHLDHALLSGFFYREDYSKEYAIDDTAMLVTVDTSTAAVTPIGPLDVVDWTHLSIAVDPANLAYALVAENPCTETLVFAIDLTSGGASLIGPVAGCLEGGAFAANGTYYAIDSASSALVDISQSAIGPLGFSVGDDATLFQMPGGATMYLVATDMSVGAMNLYTVDTVTGSATLVAPFVQAPSVYTGVAVGGALPDDIFVGSFDG